MNAKTNKPNNLIDKIMLMGGTSSHLHAEDLKFMKKLGFSGEFLRIAKQYGNFSLNNVHICWDYSWKNDRRFFFEIAKNCLPIGRIDHTCLIYILNIGEFDSKIALLSWNGELLHIFQDTFGDMLGSFVENAFTHIDKNIFVKECVEDEIRHTVELDIMRREIGDTIHLYPFKKNTHLDITRRPGEIILKNASSNYHKKLRKRKNLLIYLYVIASMILIYLVLQSFGVSLINRIAIVLVFLLCAPQFILLFNRIKSGEQRV